MKDKDPAALATVGGDVSQGRTLPSEADVAEASPRGGVPGLVWPPPEDEIEAWEVIPAAAPGAPVPLGTPPGPAPPPVAPPASPVRPEEMPAAAPSEEPADAFARFLRDRRFEDSGRVTPVPSLSRFDLPGSPVTDGPFDLSDDPPHDEAPTSRRRLAWLWVPVAVLAAAAGFWLATFLRPGAAAPDPRPSQVVIESSPAGGRVLIDGRLRGETPLTLQLPPGRHEVAVETPAGRRARTVDVTAGESVAQYFDFGTAAPRAAAAAAPPPATRSGQPSGAGPGTAPRDARAAKPAPAAASAASPSRGVSPPSRPGSSAARAPGTAPARSGTRTAPGASAPAPATTAGSLTVRSEPAGARVFLGDRLRGVTPLVLADVPAGNLELRLVNDAGSVVRRVVVSAGQQTSVLVPMPAAADTRPGSLRVRTAIPLGIVENGRPVGNTMDDRISLGPGRHDLEFVDDALGVRVPRSVVIEPGRELAIDIELPRGRVSINAQPWAEVWVGGERLGETPLGNVSLPVGRHEFVFRHPQLGERRATAVVRASTETRVAVSLEP